MLKGFTSASQHTSLNSPFDLICISVDSHQDITIPVITKFTHETLQNQVTQIDLIFFCLLQVFEGAISAIPLSVDLWVHYLNFVSQSTKGQIDGPEVMRR